jgi:exocyst complex component 3
MVHRNFERTEEMVLNLQDMNNQLNALEDMLEEDAQDILGPAPNLLPMHYQINQLEAFRNQTMHQAKKASASSRAKLAERFERLNVLIEAFDQYIVALARNIVALVRSGHPEVVVKLIKIAEREGREDEKVSAFAGTHKLTLTRHDSGHCDQAREESG